MVVAVVAEERRGRGREGGEVTGEVE